MLVLAVCLKSIDYESWRPQYIEGEIWSLSRSWNMTPVHRMGNLESLEILKCATSLYNGKSGVSRYLEMYPQPIEWKYRALKTILTFSCSFFRFHYWRAPSAALEHQPQLYTSMVTLYITKLPEQIILSLSRKN
jgi:hypothetical protein